MTQPKTELETPETELKGLGMAQKGPPIDYKTEVARMRPDSNPGWVFKVVGWVREQADVLFGSGTYVLSLQEDGFWLAPNHPSPALCEVFTQITGVKIDLSFRTPNYPLPFAPFEPVNPMRASKPTCRVCGLVFEGVMNYVCTRNDCPSGITCG